MFFHYINYIKKKINFITNVLIKRRFNYSISLCAHFKNQFEVNVRMYKSKTQFY